MLQRRFDLSDSASDRRVVNTEPLRSGRRRLCAGYCQEVAATKYSCLNIHMNTKNTHWMVIETQVETADELGRPSLFS